MTLSNARATLGLSATATLSASGTSGSIQLGPSNQNIRLTDATSGYSLLAVFAGSSDLLVLDMGTNDTTGSTTWVAGAAQVETATAAGTITTAGNATAIVTSTGMTGSPLTVTFAVALSDTAAQWAEKCRVALAANATIAERFTVSGTTTAVVLTRNPLATFTVPGGTLPIYAGNDASLNIALADATSAGITEATTSANTTSGTASDGVSIYDGDGADVEGSAVSINMIQGVHMTLNSTAAMAYTGSGFEWGGVAAGESICRAVTAGKIEMDTTLNFTAAAPSALSVTVFGFFEEDP